MAMRKMMVELLGIVVLCVVGAAWAGEAAPAPEAPAAKEVAPAPAPKAAEPAAQPAPAPDPKKQLDELKTQEKALRAKIEAIREKLKASPDVAKLREAADAADKAYDEKRKTDPACVAAAKAGADADAALRALVKEKLAASDEAKAIAKELDALADKRAALEFDEALAHMEIEYPSSPINVALRKDPEIIALRKAVDDAAADKAARDKARAAYDKARDAKRDAMPETKKALERIAAAKKGRADAAAAEMDAGKRLGKLRLAIEGGADPDVKAAQEKIKAAYEAIAEATNAEAIKAVRKARDDARDAAASKLKEVLAANPEAAPLIKEHAELLKKIASVK
jgi:hypothetical protein